MAETNPDLNKDWIFAISVICTGFLCTFGLVGNIVSIIALSKERFKNSNVYLLMALSLADWCFLLFIFNGVVIVQFCKYFGYHAYLNQLRNSKHALPTLWAIGCIIQTGAIWFVVAVTWDRFYAIGWPFKRNKRTSRGHPFKLICGVIVFAVIFNIPKFFHYHIIYKEEPYWLPIDRNHRDFPLKQNSTVKDSFNLHAEESYNLLENHLITTKFMPSLKEPYNSLETNSLVSTMANPSISADIKDSYNSLDNHFTTINLFTPSGQESYNSLEHNHSMVLSTTAFPASISATIQAVVVKVSMLYENKWYHYVYYISLSWLVMYIIPMCILIILNSLLFRQIRRARQNHAILVRSKREKESISVTVNIVAIVTIFIICQAPDFIHTLISYPSFGASRNIKEYMKNAAYAFLAFNSSINFIVYCLFYKRFRNTVLRMFCDNSSRFAILGLKKLTTKGETNLELTTCV